MIALPASKRVDPAESVAQLLEESARDPPETVLLWNVIPEYKMVLPDTPSPDHSSVSGRERERR